MIVFSLNLAEPGEPVEPGPAGGTNRIRLAIGIGLCLALLLIGG